MPPTPITIKVTKTVTHKDNSPRWLPGTTIHTTREELAERRVPSDAYEIVAVAPAAGGEPTPAPSTRKTPAA